MKKIVNSLTLMRLWMGLLIPFLWDYFNPFVLILLVAFILLTDFIDGFLARRCHVQTLFGCLLDKIADKVFGIIILILIAKYIPIYFVLIAFEVCIALLTVLGVLSGGNMSASFIGRVKMWFLGVSIFLSLLHIFYPELASLQNSYLLFVLDYRILLLRISVVLTIGIEAIVFVTYFIHMWHLIIKNSIGKKKWKSKKKLKRALWDTEYYLKHKNDSLTSLLFD